jgi:hypothetical protein
MYDELERKGRRREQYLHDMVHPKLLPKKK